MDRAYARGQTYEQRIADGLALIRIAGKLRVGMTPSADRRIAEKLRTGTTAAADR
jgi:hypothetical protein